MDDRIKILKDSVRNLNEKWYELFKIFEKVSTESNNIDLSNNYGSKNSFIELNRIIISITEWFNALLPEDEEKADSLLLNQTYLEDVTKILNSITEKSSGIIAQIKQLELKPSTLESVSGGPKLIITGVGEIDITAQINEINSNIIAAINLIEKISLHLNDQPTKNWEDYLESLQQIKIEAESTNEKIENVLNESNILHTEIKNTLDTSKKLTNEINELKESATKSSTSINAALGEVTTKLEQIREISSDAESLENSIKNYNTKFENFDKELDDRLVKYSQFEKNTEELEQKREKDEEEINRLIEKADQMIRGATVSGLSYNLDIQRKDYKFRMRWAAFFFYLSIIILFYTTYNAVSYAEPFILGKFSTFNLENTTTQNKENTTNETVELIKKSDENYKKELNKNNTIIGLISRLVLLIPAIWLTSFTSRQHSVLFNLEKEYAFKTTLAQSVEGFKREAPKYEEEISASILMDIREKPSGILSKDSDVTKSNNPILKKFQDMLFKKLEGDD